MIVFVTGASAGFGTAIARAFVVNPKVLLADEPTGNLDPELSFRLVELFKQFQAYGATVIFATHSTELMRRHPSARVMRLEDGMITQANWPGARLFPHPEQKESGWPGAPLSLDAENAPAREEQLVQESHDQFRGRM